MRIRAVGAVITRADDRVLLVLRANDPGKDRWSLPGGRIEPGETPEEALVREVLEETGLQVDVEEPLGHLTIATNDVDDYVVTDYRCRVFGGELTAGDDAAAVRWAALAELADIPTTPNLPELLREWLSAEG